MNSQQKTLVLNMLGNFQTLTIFYMNSYINTSCLSVTSIKTYININCIQAIFKKMGLSLFLQLECMKLLIFQTIHVDVAYINLTYCSGLNQQIKGSRGHKSYYYFTLGMEIVKIMGVVLVCYLLVCYLYMNRLTRWLQIFLYVTNLLQKYNLTIIRGNIFFEVGGSQNYLSENIIIDVVPFVWFFQLYLFCINKQIHLHNWVFQGAHCWL
eukprot:TRINITY_DN28221_c0_g1_i3.p1 TRINITY_DN28221_c0_g1~~TRINITY_DN28221_c0_g1_i3.p1  ORF type:complete len:210 (-),score=-17.91 TRINITY_DN28221_c0_g1_i3:122-751(-)